MEEGNERAEDEEKEEKEWEEERKISSKKGQASVVFFSEPKA